MPVILDFADTAGLTILLNEHIPDDKENNRVKPRALCIGQSWRGAARYNSAGEVRDAAEKCADTGKAELTLCSSKQSGNKT